jgi:hypothetical protein
VGQGQGEHTFFPPRSLFPELDRLKLSRGSRITVRTSERVSEDGRVFPRYDVAPVDSPVRPPATPSNDQPKGKNSILASVALKAAVAARSEGDLEVIMDTADQFLTWLSAR